VVVDFNYGNEMWKVVKAVVGDEVARFHDIRVGELFNRDCGRDWGWVFVLLLFILDGDIIQQRFALLVGEIVRSTNLIRG